MRRGTCFEVSFRPISWQYFSLKNGKPPTWANQEVIVTLLLFFISTEASTQDFAVVRQTLYHFSHASRPDCDLKIELKIAFYCECLYMDLQKTHKPPPSLQGLSYLFWAAMFVLQDFVWPPCPNFIQSGHLAN
jgi:hypothetical protein